MSEESEAFYLNNDQLKTPFKKIGDEKAVPELINENPVMSEIKKKWWEEDNVIYLDITSNGFSGQEWLRYKKVISDSNSFTRSLLLSPKFSVTPNGLTQRIAILKYNFFKDYNDRTTRNILLEGKKHHWYNPRADLALQVFSLLTFDDMKEMGIGQIIPMHRPITDNNGQDCFLRTHVFRRKLWLEKHRSDLDITWFCRSGFAFIVPEEQVLR